MFTYDANGERTQALGYRWDESTSGWIPIDKIAYTYDASDNLTQSLYNCWEEGTSQFVECWKEEYTYETTIARSNLILPCFNDKISIIEAIEIYELFDHKLDGFLGSLWDETGMDWIPQLKGDYHYSERNVSSVEETGMEISKVAG